MDLNKNIDPERTGKFIKILRKAHNMTQDQLGEKLFITRKAVSKWETGRACPSIDMLKKLSEIFGVSLEDIIEGDFEKLEALLENNDNVLYKTVPNENLKVGNHLVLKSIIIIIVLVVFIISNFSETKVYSLTCEDEIFSIDNGVLVLSNRRSYINLGTIYHNDKLAESMDEIEYKLFFNDYTGEKELLTISRKGNIDLPRSVNNLLKKSLDKNENNLFLKVKYTNSSNVKIEDDLRLFAVEKKETLRKNFHSDEFGKNLLGSYPGNLVPNFISEIDHLDDEPVFNENVDSIDLSFLYNLSAEEIKEKYDNKKIIIDGESFDVVFDEVNNILSVYNDNFKADFRIIFPSIKIGENMFYNLATDKILVFDGTYFTLDDFSLLNYITKSLSSF